MHDCSSKVIISRHGKIVPIPYNNWQGWPNACELHACPRIADEYQAEKVWRRENDGSPPPAYVNQAIPLEGTTPYFTYVFQSIKIQYVKEDVVRKYVDCGVGCTHS
jgi:hypothetical protein